MLNFENMQNHKFATFKTTYCLHIKKKGTSR